MSKEVKLGGKLSEINEAVMVHGFYVERFDYFLGRILTLIETLGLNETQEKAFKDIIRQEVWHLWEHAPFMEEKTLELGKTNSR